MQVSLVGEGLLQPGALKRWGAEQAERTKRAIARGIKAARPRTDEIMRRETRAAFKLATNVGGKFERAWRIRLVESSSGAGLQVMNMARWFRTHVEGETIRSSRGRALLIPMSMRLGMRVTNKRFKQIVDWLSKEKMLVVRGDILYARPLMNTSRRGGVAVGTRVTKKFRSKFQGAKRRPSGFDIKLNAEGLTPIAHIKQSITMRKRFDLEGIARRRVAPVLATHIGNALASSDIRL